jgi:hypothetical protein
MQTITKIEYSPCAGFGAHGRTASLYSGAVCVGAGHGATDAEAVTEALAAAGMNYDDAADAAGPLITSFA